MNVIKANELPLYLTAQILALTPKHHIFKINNRKKIINLSMNHGQEDINIKGTITDIRDSFNNKLKEYTDLGLSIEHAFYAAHREFKPHHVVYVPAGTHRAKIVSGTYFGSGSYTASFRTSGFATPAEDKDTGFAMEEFYDVELRSGEYIIQYQYASPGGCIKKIIIAE